MVFVVPGVSLIIGGIMIRSTKSRQYEQPERETARNNKRKYVLPPRDRVRAAMKYGDWAILISLDGHYRRLKSIFSMPFGYWH